MMWKARYSNLLIKNKIFLFTLAIMTTVSGISMIAVQFATTIYEDKVYTEAAQVLNLSSISVDNELRRVEQLSFQILSDATTQRYLSDVVSDLTDYETYKTKDILMDRLMSLGQQEKFISAIQMIDADGSEHFVSLTSKNRADVESVLPAARNAAGANVWVPSNHNNVIIAAREIRQIENLNLRHLGYLIITVDMSRLVSQALDLEEDRIFMLEHNDRIVLSTRPELAFDLNRLPVRDHQGYRIAEMEGEKYFVTHLTSKYQYFTYYNILEYESVFNQASFIKRALLGLYVLLFVAALYLGRLASKTISKPLEQLTLKMKQVQKGNIDPMDLFREENLNMDETGHIHRHFRLMLERINELIRENYQKQLAIKESEYKALQAQINPHFLYNTLESINWMAKINKQHDISRMAEALGSLLRGIINKKEALIPLKDELQIINNYVTIQQIRFGERLQFRDDHEPRLERYLIPKLTIQPLIENVIQHSLEVISDPCVIELAIVPEADHMEIVVRDNGPGIDAETLTAIRNGQVKPKGTGIGLKNIRERIQLVFGDEYGVEIDSEPGNGTSVRIRIPYRLEG